MYIAIHIYIYIYLFICIFLIKYIILTFLHLYYDDITDDDDVTRIHGIQANI